MKTRKLYLISPREPCGATWLINCLLVCGIKTYRTTVDGGMWRRSGDNWTLNPLESPLKKWLPILSEREQFAFREDVEVEWAHQWPTGQTAGAGIIYFVRDPRDALLSRYRREAPDVSFKEFLDFPDAQSLLDKMESWNLFNEAWLAQSDLKVFRFEDYKVDALKTLAAIDSFARLVLGSSGMTQAVQQSGFAQAAAAEARYRASNPQDTQVINRASQVGNWKDPSLAQDMAEILRRCGAVMSRLGYVGAADASVIPCSYRPHATRMRFYRGLAVSPSFWNRPPDGGEELRRAAATALAVQLDASSLGLHRMQAYEEWQLLAGLREFLPSLPAGTIGKLRAMQQQVSSSKGLAWRIRALVLPRAWWLPVVARNRIRALARAAKSLLARVSR